MKKEIKFYVIGGQYRYYCYGGSATLQGAKCLASKNEEYWDNWQGWHTPKIYRAEDTEEVTTEDGRTVRIPKDFVTYYTKVDGKWVEI